jgi:hypothetical protein
MLAFFLHSAVSLAELALDLRDSADHAHLLAACYPFLKELSPSPIAAPDRQLRTTISEL